jgi:hypothetical protein
VLYKGAGGRGEESVLRWRLKERKNYEEKVRRVKAGGKGEKKSMRAQG